MSKMEIYPDLNYAPVKSGVSYFLDPCDRKPAAGQVDLLGLFVLPLSKLEQL
jgi:hypothetical protein